MIQASTKPVGIPNAAPRAALAAKARPVTLHRALGAALMLLGLVLFVDGMRRSVRHLSLSLT